MAARTIDPATGASTWALGSQRWTVNIGSLTKKARKTRTVKTLKDHKKSRLRGTVRRTEVISILEDPISLLAQTTIRRRGSEAATV